MNNLIKRLKKFNKKNKFLTKIWKNTLNKKENYERQTKI